MKAAIFYKPNPILPIEDINIRSPLKGEVLIKLSAAGVCHSDYHFMTGMMDSILYFKMSVTTHTGDP